MYLLNYSDKTLQNGCHLSVHNVVLSSSVLRISSFSASQFGFICMTIAFETLGAHGGACWGRLNADVNDTSARDYAVNKMSYPGY